MIRDTKFYLLPYIVLLHRDLSIEIIVLYTMGSLCRSGIIIILPHLHNDSIVYNLVIIYINFFFKKSVAGEYFLCLL